MLKDPLPMGYRLENLLTKPAPELHHALLMTRGAEMTALAGKRQQVFVMAVATFYPGKAEMQISALQIAQDNVHYIGAPEAVPALIAVIPNPFQLLEMVLRATIIIALPGVAGTVAVGNELFHAIRQIARYVPSLLNKTVLDMQCLWQQWIQAGGHKGWMRRTNSVLFKKPEYVYPQMWGDFIGNLSTLDMIFTCGSKARDIIRV